MDFIMRPWIVAKEKIASALIMWKLIIKTYGSGFIRDGR